MHTGYSTAEHGPGWQLAGCLLLNTWLLAACWLPAGWATAQQVAAGSLPDWLAGWLMLAISRQHQTCHQHCITTRRDIQS